MKNKYFKLICFVVGTTVCSAQVISQKVGTNPTVINSSAVLEVESNNKGILIPRIALTSTTDTSTINTPATSLFIFNTATAGTSPNNVTPGFYYWNGSVWVRIATGNALTSEVDGVIGNEVTDAVTNGGLTRSGTGTAADPYKLKINDGTATGQILVWDGSKWVTQAVPAEVDGVVGNEVSNATTNRGLVRAGAGTSGDPFTLGLTAGTTTGQVYKWDGTNWAPGTDAGLTSEVDGVVGNEVSNATTNRGLVRAGAGTSGDPFTLGLTAGTTTGQVYKWDGTNWAPGTDAGLTSEVDGVVGNEVSNATTNRGLVRAGAGTSGDPFTLGLTAGTTTGQVYKWDGTNWAPGTDAGLTSEVDGVIGNEVTDAVTNGGLTRSGTGTAADPYKLKINDGTATGQNLVWDGTKWVAQAASSDWKLTGNAGTNATTNFIGTTDATDFSFRTNNLERMRVLSTGNVGIGTTAPAARLDVAQLNEATINYPLTVRNLSTTGSGGGSGTGIDFVSHSNISAGKIATVNDVPGETSMMFSTFNGEAMRIKGKNVGIGTTSPPNLLTVSGTSWVPFKIENTSFASTTGMTAQQRVGLELVQNGNVYGELYTNQFNSVADLSLRNRYENGNITFVTNKNGTNNFNTMTIQGSTGNVGIGTATPNSKLEILGTNLGAGGTAETGNEPLLKLLKKGTAGTQNSTSAQLVLGANTANINAYTQLDFKLASGPSASNNWGENPDNTVMSLFGNGNVGIGNTNPLSKLEVYGQPSFGNGVGTMLLGNNIAGQNNATTLGFWTGNGGTFDISKYSDGASPSHAVYLNQRNNAPILFGTSNTERMRINGSGNVGIGTTTPSERLDISGGNLKLNDGGFIINDTNSNLWSNTYSIMRGSLRNYMQMDINGDTYFGSNQSKNVKIANGNLIVNNSIGIGTGSPNSSFHAAGSMATSYMQTASAITLNNTHYRVRIDAGASNIAVTLPDPTTVSGRMYSILKGDDTSNKLTFNYTITGNGYTFTEINIAGEYNLQSNGVNWVLINN